MADRLARLRCPGDGFLGLANLAKIKVRFAWAAEPIGWGNNEGHAVRMPGGCHCNWRRLSRHPWQDTERQSAESFRRNSGRHRVDEFHHVIPGGLIAPKRRSAPTRKAGGPGVPREGTDKGGGQESHARGPATRASGRKTRISLTSLTTSIPNSHRTQSRQILSWNRSRPFPQERRSRRSNSRRMLSAWTSFS